MGMISQYLKLIDGVSKPLMSMTDAAEALTNAEEHAASGAGALENATRELGSQATKTTGILSGLKSAVTGAIGQFAMGNIAANVLLRVADYAAQIPGKIIAASDAYAGMKARLQLVTGSAQNAAEMNDLIYQSALRARGSYDGMADSVSKIAMTAKDAFPDPREVVPFVEGIQKLFTIGGTGIQQQGDAMLQLTQALGSGKLQGDEFRSIAEAAPLIEQMISKHMGVAQGELKQLGSEGKITAEIIKASILENMDEIDRQFKTMPLTWGQAMQEAGTLASKAFWPLYDRLSAVINGSGLADTFLNAVSVIVPGVAAIASRLVDAFLIVSPAISVVANGIIWLGQTVMSVGGYINEWLIAGFIAGFNTLMSLAEAVLPFVSGAVMAYALVWEALNIQMQYNAVMSALAAVWHGAVAAVTWTATAATAAWAAITKGMTAAQIALNLVLAANPIGIVIGLVGFIIGAFAAWQVSTMGLRNAVAAAFKSIASVAESAINFMIGMVNGLINLLNKAAEGINNTFHTNISTVGTISWKAEGWGDKAEDFVKNFSFSDLMPQMPNAAGMGAPAAAMAGGAGLEMPGEGEAAKQTAGNTKGILDAMGILDEDVKYFRDAAESSVISEYTNAPVNITLGGVTQNISNGTDENEVITHLVEKLWEAQESGGEGAHE